MVNVQPVENLGESTWRLSKLCFLPRSSLRLNTHDILPHESIQVIQMSRCLTHWMLTLRHRVNISSPTEPTPGSEVTREAWASASQTFSQWELYGNMCLMLKSWRQRPPYSSCLLVINKAWSVTSKFATVIPYAIQNAPTLQLLSDSDHIFCHPHTTVTSCDILGPSMIIPFVRGN